MSRKGPSDSQPDLAPLQGESLLPGTAFVRFDAGGQGTFIDPNPLYPVLQPVDRQERLRLTWTLGLPEHSNLEWRVRFGNIVPCDQREPLLAGLSSAPYGRNGTVWIWDWPRPQHLPRRSAQIQLFYDIFFAYEHVPLLRVRPRQERSRLPQIASLRSMMSVDPTIILPPKDA